MFYLLLSTTTKIPLSITLLHYTTLVLTFTGIAMMLVYLFFTTFFPSQELFEKGKSIAATIRYTLTWALLFSVLSCFFSSPETLYISIEKAQRAFFIMTISLGGAVICSGVVMLVLAILGKADDLDGMISCFKTSLLEGGVACMLLCLFL